MNGNRRKRRLILPLSRPKRRRLPKTKARAILEQSKLSRMDPSRDLKGRRLRLELVQKRP